MVAVGAHRHDADTHAGEFLEMLDVVARGLGQLLVGLALGDVDALPAGQLLVHRFGVEQHALLHGEVIVDLAVALVGGADLDRVELGQHVELGQRHIGETVDLGRIARDDRVEPAAASLAARRHAELVAGGAQALAHLGLLALAAVLSEAQLGGEGTAADARDVGFLDAQHAVDGRGSHARSGRRAARAA